MLCPLLPGIADSPEQIDRLVKFAADFRVEEIFCEPVNARGNGLSLCQQALQQQGHHVWRWARKGLRGIRLDYQRLGGKIVVTEAAIRKFMAELTKLDSELGEQASDSHRQTKPRQQRMSEQELQAELHKEGLW